MNADQHIAMLGAQVVQEMNWAVDVFGNAAPA